MDIISTSFARSRPSLSRISRSLRSETSSSSYTDNEEIKSESSESSGIDHLRRRYIREQAVRLGNIDRAEIINNRNIINPFRLDEFDSVIGFPRGLGNLNILRVNVSSSEDSDFDTDKISKVNSLLNNSNIEYKPISGSTLKKILECQICCGQMSESNNLMCYHCSKTWCSKCFRLAIQRDKRCPNCRKPINKPSLIKNCLLSEIIQTQTIREIEEETNSCFCMDHNERLTMKCLTCDCNICTECVSSDQHIGHTIKSLKHLHEQAKHNLILSKEQLEKYEIEINKTQDKIIGLKNNKENQANTAAK